MLVDTLPLADQGRFACYLGWNSVEKRLDQAGFTDPWFTGYEAELVLAASGLAQKFPQASDFLLTAEQFFQAAGGCVGFPGRFALLATGNKPKATAMHGFDILR